MGLRVSLTEQKKELGRNYIGDRDSDGCCHTEHHYICGLLSPATEPRLTVVDGQEVASPAHEFSKEWGGRGTKKRGLFGTAKRRV